MVNQDSHGVHPAGEFCVKMSGKVCGSAAPTATATLVDLSHDGQRAPHEPRVSGAQSMKYNYADVLQKSVLFYEAQRSGKLPSHNRIPWRGDSGLHDRGDHGEDLTGGWYDAGDNVKFNFPMAWSTTVLCWGLLEFKEAYSKAGQLDYMYDSLRWPLEYFLKCHTKSDELYVQVGSGGVDHGSWTSPERMDPDRPAYKVDAHHPGSDVANEMAAAMACGYIVFKDKDRTFAGHLLSHAKQIYSFAKSHQGFYSTSVSDAAAYYRSQNYTDENVWGGLWLHKATGDDSYLHDAKKWYSHEPAWGFSWDEKLAGNQYRQWAMCQIHYSLGDSGRSYVIGFGKNYPTRPHHRASSCPMLPAPCGWEAQQAPGPNPHTLYGALVGGPGKHDDYTDDRKDYVHNEVACDYNAGFQSACADS
nr:hypothetical protein BaRGS_017726 [Batillaria attramentaria]